MTIRDLGVINKTGDINDLYEDDNPRYVEVPRKQSAKELLTDLKNKSYNVNTNSVSVLKSIIQIIIGLVIIYIGIFNSGSVYLPNMILTGRLATIMYVYQLGNILQIIGCITVYHGFINVIPCVYDKICEFKEHKEI